MPLVASEHDWYVRLGINGVLATGIASEATPDDIALIARHNRFLIDLSGVTDITADALVLADTPRAPAQRAIRLAVLAPNPLAFGWTRQVILAGDVDPERVAVFRDEPAALSWLEASAPAER